MAIPGFLAGKGAFGIAKLAWWALLLVGALALVAGIARNVRGSAEDAADRGERTGRAEAVAAGQDLTFEQIGDAHEAASAIRGDVGFARYCQCLRDAAEGFAGSCKREIEDRSLLDDDQAAAAACPEKR